MGKQTFKFKVGDEVLDHHGFKVVIKERQINKRFGHNEYRLESDILRVWRAETQLKPID